MKTSRSMTAVVMIIFMLSFQVTPQLWAENSPSPTVQPPPNMNNQPTVSGNQPPQTGSAEPPPIDSLPSVDQFQAGEEGALDAITTAEVVNSTDSKTDSDKNTPEESCDDQCLQALYDAMVAAIAEADRLQVVFEESTEEYNEAQAELDALLEARRLAELDLGLARIAVDYARQAQTNAFNVYARLAQAVFDQNNLVVAARVNLRDAQATEADARDRFEESLDDKQDASNRFDEADNETSRLRLILEELNPNADPEIRRNLEEQLRTAEATRAEALEAFYLAEAVAEEAASGLREARLGVQEAREVLFNAQQDAISADEEASAARTAYEAAGRLIETRQDELLAAQRVYEAAAEAVRLMEQELEELRAAGEEAYRAWDAAIAAALAAIDAYNQALASSNP